MTATIMFIVGIGLIIIFKISFSWKNPLSKVKSRFTSLVLGFFISSIGLGILITSVIHAFNGRIKCIERHCNFFYEQANNPFAFWLIFIFEVICSCITIGVGFAAIAQSFKRNTA